MSSATAVASLSTTPPTPASEAKPEIAFTFDDPTTNGGMGLPWRELNAHILDTLATHNIRSVLFVCGMRVDSEEGHELITSWDHRGHLIGNHSYSHLFFDKVTLGEYESDMLKNEPLITSYPHFTRLFRYPYFKEGNTVQKRDGMRSLLQQHGYRIGRATIDASDWAINARMEARFRENPRSELTGYREFYLQHI